MRKQTRTILLTASAIYYVILFLALSFLPTGFTLPMYFLAAPLLILVLILANNLSSRVTVPRKVETRNPPSRVLSREVQALTRQIEVGVDSSPEYFEKVLLERLREVLAEKVALETNIDRERVRGMLANPSLGPGLLRNDRLHRLLYSGAPGKGSARVKMLDETIALVESWKP